MQSKGFELNAYPEGKFWEFQITDDEERKIEICEVFAASIDLFDNSIDVDTLILQCAKDFTKCIFYYDCNPFDLETVEFMRCIEKI